MDLSLKRFVQSSVGKLGYKIVRGGGAGSTDGLIPLFSMLKQRGVKPKHILDVGANRGYWTRMALRFFPDAHYTLVEPQDALKTYVQDLIDAGYKIKWINAGASDKPSKMQFTLAERDDSSTFTLSEEQARRAGLRQIHVEVKTLNDIVREVDEPAPQIMKIDAEGLDLQVLDGASDLLGNTDVILVEAAVLDKSKENTLPKVMKRMDEAGYRLIDFTDLNRSPKDKILWLCEAVFLRNGSTLLDSVTSYE